MGQFFVSAVVIAILFVFILIYSLFRRYKRCPSDRILVVYGKVGGGDGRTAKCIHGGAAFIWPIIQDYEFLDLTPIPIEVDLENALSKQNIRVNVPSRFMVGISTEPGIMQNAAERLLGLTMQQIQHLAADIIFGQLRVVIATMNIEEINADREKFLINVSDSVEHELKKIGLKLINVNVTDITDAAGYIEALGKEATAHAINDAKKLVAEKDRDGAIGEAEARQDQRIKVAAANAKANIGEAEAQKNERVEVSSKEADAKIGEAKAQQNERIQTAAANAEAIKGENDAKITIANSDAERRVKEAEATKIAATAEKIYEANALEESYNAQKLAEQQRAERDKATQYANIVVPAEIEKQKVEIQAEAEAERIRRIAKGDADALFFKMEAEAKGNLQLLSKQAEGFNEIVKAAGLDPKNAVLLMVADKLPELVKLQVEAIKNIKIDKITVWENGGNSANGKTNTANFVSGMLGSLPPFEELFKMAGMELPDYLKGKEVKDITDFQKKSDDKPKA
jgi:flotillin